WELFGSGDLNGLSDVDTATAINGQILVYNNGVWENTSDYVPLTQYNQERHFRGQYTSLSALNIAVPSANIGDFANVDNGVGSDVSRYIWDSNDNQWILSISGAGSVDSVNGILPDGSGNVLISASNITTGTLPV